MNINQLVIVGEIMVKDSDLRSQNDNSREYREKRKKQTESLLKRALSYVKERDKNFSHKNICDVMLILADEEDKKLKAAISPSAISKNQSLKNIIKIYKTQNDILKEKQKKYHLSEGDMAFELHKCKTLLAQKNDEVKILKDIIQKEQISVENQVVKIKNEDFDYKHLLKEAYEIIKKEQVAFISGENLILEIDHSVVANKKLLIELGLL